MKTIEELLTATENEHIERKSAQNNFHFEELLKYVCAISNEGGGKLILGVSNDGHVVGTSVFQDMERLKIDVLSSQKLSRKIRIKIEEFKSNGKRVLVVSIPSRPKGEPVAFNGAYFMRSGESLVPMDVQTLKRIFDEYEDDFSSEICNDISYDDLDESAIKKMKELWSRKSGNPEILKLDDRQVLSDLGLIIDSSITYAALILIGKKSAIDLYLRNAEIIWEYRRDVSSIEYLD